LLKLLLGRHHSNIECPRQAEFDDHVGWDVDGFAGLRVAPHQVHADSDATVDFHLSRARISQARLKAVPWVDYCHDCMEQGDVYLRRYVGIAACHEMIAGYIAA
jgi:hypothetical protein